MVLNWTVNLTVKVHCWWEISNDIYSQSAVVFWFRMLFAITRNDFVVWEMFASMPVDDKSELSSNFIHPKWFNVVFKVERLSNFRFLNIRKATLFPSVIQLNEYISTKMLFYSQHFRKIIFFIYFYFHILAFQVTIFWW